MFFLIAHLVSIFFIFTCYPIADVPSVEDLLNRHKVSRSLAESASCTIAVKFGKAGGVIPESGRGTFWASNNMVKALGKENGKDFIYVWKNSVKTSLLTKTGGQRGIEYGASRISTLSSHMSNIDPWVRGLLSIPPPESPAGLKIEQLIEKCSNRDQMQVLKESNEGLLKIKMHFNELAIENRDPWEMEVYFDPKVNYLISKVVYTRTGDNFKRTEETVAFKEVHLGVFFPEKTSTISESGGKVTHQGESVITSIKLNPELDSDFFKIQFPSGIFLADNLTKTYYQINEEGDPISKIRFQAKSPPSPRIEEDGIQPGMVTKSEPISWVYYILPGSLVVLAASVGLFYFRQAKAA